MSKIYVYSTLTSGQSYTIYAPEHNGVPRILETISINGGANLASKQLITPLGVRTEITEEQLEKLKENRLFKMHVEGGFIKTMKIKTDPEKVVPDLESRDRSAPIVPQDYEFSNNSAKPEIRTEKPTAIRKPIVRKTSAKK